MSDTYFSKLLETGQIAFQPTLYHFLSRSSKATAENVRQINFELVELFVTITGKCVRRVRG